MELRYLTAGNWMIENALELLDAPNEYYHDAAAGKLYMWPNGAATSMTLFCTIFVTFHWIFTALHAPAWCDLFGDHGHRMLIGGPLVI